MTLRSQLLDTVRYALECLLDWAKRNRDYFGSLKSQYETKLSEERQYQKLRKEYEDKHRGD